MKITIPVDGVVQTIPVPFRVWLAHKFYLVIEWLVAPEYIADLDLKEQPSVADAPPAE